MEVACPQAVREGLANSGGVGAPPSFTLFYEDLPMPAWLAQQEDENPQTSQVLKTCEVFWHWDFLGSSPCQRVWYNKRMKMGDEEMPERNQASTGIYQPVR